MWARFVRASEAEAQGGGGVRPPPLHPEAFAAKLARKVFTNGKSDLEMVAGIYARTLDGAFGGAERLLFEPRLGRRGGEGVGKGAAAREERDASQSLRQRPKIGADGWRALAEAIAAGGAPRLNNLAVRDYPGVADLGRRRAEEGVRGAWDRAKG